MCVWGGVNEYVCGVLFGAYANIHVCGGQGKT